jgi:precorrin-6B methylase 2
MRSRSGTFTAAPATNTVRIAPVPLATVRHHSHPQRFVRGHPGILIIEVPHFVESTVVTSYAPGVVRADRRLVEESSGRAPERGPGQLAPFDPTPQEVVERMLKLARVKGDDVLYDLGSGDGRLVIAAAKKFGARAVGFELDAGLVKLARENARKAGVENLVEFRQQDFLTADISPASVVTLYLSYDGNLAVRPQLMQQLRSGARVVSYTFDMGDWSAKIAESYRDKAGNAHMLYLWEIGGGVLFSDAK